MVDTIVTRVHLRSAPRVYKCNDGEHHCYFFPHTKVAHDFSGDKSCTNHKFLEIFNFLFFSTMDLAQLNDTANLLKLLQQFGGDTDMADKEIDAVINTCLESGLKSTIMDDFRLLVQISVRDEPSDRSFFRIRKNVFSSQSSISFPDSVSSSDAIVLFKQIGRNTLARKEKNTRKSGG